MRTSRITLWLAGLVLMTSSQAVGDAVQTDPKSQPKELGSVSWYRSLDDGIAAAKAAGRPLFVQFQEVPG